MIINFAGGNSKMFLFFPFSFFGCLFLFSSTLRPTFFPTSLPPRRISNSFTDFSHFSLISLTAFSFFFRGKKMTRCCIFVKRKPFFFSFSKSFFQFFAFEIKNKNKNISRVIFPSRISNKCQVYFETSIPLRSLKG